MSLSFDTFAKGLIGGGVQPGFPALIAQQRSKLQQNAIEAKVAAMQAHYQQQAYNQQIAQQQTALTSGTMWTNTTTASTTTALFNFATTGTVSTYNAVQQAQWQLDENDLDQLAEQRLQQLLTKRRQLLLDWKKMVPPPKFNFAREDTPVAFDCRISEGYILERGKQYVLPDGATLVIDDRGNYGINDQDAKVVYRANRIREFNPYVNASDLMVAFVKEVGQLDGVNQDEVLRLPLEAFINWLILQAAKKDGDNTAGLPTVQSALALPAPKQQVAA